MDCWEISSKSVCSRKISLFRQKNLLSNLIPRVPSFYIRIKSRVKNRVTTVHLLQCKTNFFIRLFFLHSSTQVKEHPFWEASVNIKKKIFFDSLTLVYICLHSSTFVYNRLDSSSGSSTLVYIRLVTCLHSSTFVYTLLDSSSDSSVFLEQICFRKVKQRTITYLIT